LPSKSQRKIAKSFLDFVGNTSVHERNSDTWEFGKGALSANSSSLAVLQSERGKRVGGLRVEAEGKMSKSKWRNLWESGKTSSEREWSRKYVYGVLPISLERTLKNFW